MNDDLSKLSGEMYRHWEKAVGAYWDQALQSPAFLQQMGDSMTWQSKARRDWEDKVDETMKQMHLPSRKDVVRLARVATLLEDRILAMEDRLLEMQDQMVRIEAESLRARVDATEALVTVKEKLESLADRLEKGQQSGLSDQLSAIQAQLASLGATEPAKARTGRSTKRSSEEG